MKAADRDRDPKPVHLCHVTASVHTGDHGVRIYTMALDKTGGLWERWSDWAPGRWEEVERPAR